MVNSKLCVILLLMGSMTAQTSVATTDDTVTDSKMPPWPPFTPPIHPYYVNSKFAYLNRIIDHIVGYVSLVVLPLSLIFNVATMIMFLQPHRIKQSASILMISIAFVDIWSLSIDWANMIDYFTDFYLVIFGNFCEAVMYISYACRSLSSWYIFLFTVERFISVRFPLKRSSMLTKKRFGLAFALTTLLVLISQAYLIVFYDGTIIGCRMMKKYTNYSNKVRFGLREILCFLVPSLLAGGLNIGIITSLRSWRKKQPNLKGSDDKAKETHNKSLTFMLIAVSSFSIVVYFPRSISQIYFDSLGYMTYNEIVMDKLLECFAILNHSCNFFLYCLSGKTFREDFLRIISCYKCKWSFAIIMYTVKS